MFSFIFLLGGIIAGKIDGNLRLLLVFYFYFIFGGCFASLDFGGGGRAPASSECCCIDSLVVLSSVTREREWKEVIKASK